MNLTLCSLNCQMPRTAKSEAESLECGD